MRSDGILEAPSCEEEGRGIRRGLEYDDMESPRRRGGPEAGEGNDIVSNSSKQKIYYGKLFKIPYLPHSRRKSDLGGEGEGHV